MSERTPGVPEPLSREELSAVARWGRWMRLGLVAGLAGLASWVGWLVAGEPPELVLLLPVAGTAILAFGFVVVFAGGCPRCGARLRAEPGLRVPSRCRRCGVRLRA